MAMWTVRAPPRSRLFVARKSTTWIEAVPYLPRLDMVPRRGKGGEAEVLPHSRHLGPKSPNVIVGNAIGQTEVHPRNSVIHDTNVRHRPSAHGRTHPTTNLAIDMLIKPNHLFLIVVDVEVGLPMVTRENSIGGHHHHPILATMRLRATTVSHHDQIPDDPPTPVPIPRLARLPDPMLALPKAACIRVARPLPTMLRPDPITLHGPLGSVGLVDLAREGSVAKTQDFPPLRISPRARTVLR